MNSVILLTVDSLRADSVDSNHLTQSRTVLDRDFLRFTRSYSHGIATPFAFPGIMAGVHPVGNGNIPETATTLAEGIEGPSTGLANNGHLRADRGYARGFSTYEENPTIDGMGEISYIDRIARRLQKIDRVRESNILKTIYNDFLRDPLPISTVPADGMTELVKRTLADETNTFVWGHWMDPHLPYHPDYAIDPPENVPSLEELDELRERIAEGDAKAVSEEELDLSRALYEANIRYFDRYFGELLQWMTEQAWYDKSLIAVISDHGELFGEHGRLFHPWDIDPVDELIETPFWVKYPDQDHGGTTISHPVAHGDFVATVAEVLDEHSLEPPDHTASLRQKSGRHIVSLSNTAKRLTEENGSYIYRRDGTEKEQGSVSDSGKEFMNELEFPEIRNSEGKAEGVEDATRRRRLANLGYR